MKNLCTIAVLLGLIFSGCSVEKKPVSVKFEGRYFEKKWSLKELNPELPSDWSTYEFLTFDLRSSTTQKFDLKIFDSSGIRRVSINPFQGTWFRASIPLVHFQKRNTKGMDLAAIGKTGRPGYWIGFSGNVGSVKHIDSLSLSMRLPIATPVIELKNVMLTMTAMDSVYGPYPLVDEFGQWVPAQWEGKALSQEDLKKAWEAEDKSLGEADFNVSSYGGFLDGKTNATGYFRVEKIDGRWWFVDPDGYLFYSTGSTGIGPRSEFSRIKGREYIFKELPPADISKFSGQATVQPAGRPAAQSTSFFSWNLYRRFGEGWYAKWKDFTVRRMNNWGLNTIANWSDVGLGESGKKAWVATLRGWGIETGIMGMPDVFAPDYIDKVDKAAEQQCAPRKDDPYLLGYFIGNEPAWPHRELELVNEVLAGPETPMQKALKEFLAKGDTPEKRKEFVYQAYSRFLEIVNSAIKKHDPHHLNLGLRFGGSVPDEIIETFKGFDVFSVNIYGYSVNHDLIKKINERTGLPVIIGEFHFGVPERGLAPGLAQTINQEERAAAYRYYVENAAADPAIIGTHWFQWIDQPATGRNDGENYNIGFVDVTDRPYKELVEASKETFRRIFEIHSGKISPVSREALRQ